MASPGLFLFCVRSLWREYGIAFLGHVLLRHPVRTLRGIRRYLKQRDTQVNPESVSDESTLGPSPGIPTRTLVGLGFCLKPQDPSCPSGRANHLCEYLERRGQEGEPEDPPPACRSCQIRELGLRALQRGCAVYIMTSARDILFDLLLPVMEENRYEHALLTLCRYSFDPFRMALAVAGLDARLFAFESGDCRDYKSWLQADRGIKREQTCISAGNLEEIYRFLKSDQKDVTVLYKRAGNVFLPENGWDLNPGNKSI